MKTLLIFAILFSLNLEAACLIQKNTSRHDILNSILEAAVTCPRDVREFKKLLTDDGLKTIPSFVANRGFHNPNLGSFSIFESTQGLSQILNKNILPEHLYFGHFTDLNKNREIILDQNPSPNKLIIEAIAYDFAKGVYNFYELIGTSSGSQWFYRGDSYDIYEDNKFLKIEERPQFGNRLRCSGCHTTGGPIMKELSYPHNDWWTNTRPLPFGTNSPSEEIKKYLAEFRDASEFSNNVRRGILLLEKKNILKTRSLREKLRPLFCGIEINLKSDVLPIDSPLTTIEISSETFIDSFLVPPKMLKMSKSFYLNSLIRLGAIFPETQRRDADHAFLAPVRSETTQIQVKQLIVDNIIDEEFALDVLSIDFMNPLFSGPRCALLKFVTNNGSDWKNTFKNNLFSENDATSLELLQKMKTRDGHLHKNQALNYLLAKQESWKNQTGVNKEVQSLNKLRLYVFKDAISQNPKGQILEPGFRVIFPVFR